MLGDVSRPGFLPCQNGAIQADDMMIFVLHWQPVQVSTG
jgi:hypothetical protein